MTRSRERAPAGDALGEHVGALLCELARGGDAALLRATASLLCAEREAGNVCVRLADWEQRTGPRADSPFPTAADWRRELEASGICCDGSDGCAPAPLVLDGRGRLYLLRHFRAERRIASWLRERVGRGPLASAPSLRGALAATRAQPETGSDGADWQLAAVCAAARSSFAVITGGPGTGKTTTVARLLAVLLHAQPDLRVALCAPTGKAAARLDEAIAAGAAAAPERRANGARAGLSAITLHRLLGYLPLQDAFRFGRDRRLPHDLVVVDEASMVDPALLDVLLQAMRPDARLVLVGDRDQLASIAAGQVLGDVCRAARPERGAGRELAAFAAAAADLRLPVQEDAPPLADAVVALRTNRRFASQPGIGAFAAALAARDAAGAAAALRAGHEDLAVVADPDAALAALAEPLLATFACDEPARALRSLRTFRVLCALRHGPYGVDGWNRRIEAFLAARGVRVRDPWYRGRPVLIVANDQQNQLFNGDLGVCWPDAGGAVQVWFAARGGGVRAVSPLRLPPHETAWAITVHKAQGSEFDRVVLALPDRDGPLWHGALLYTGVTRARSRVLVVADERLLVPALSRWPARSSGLADALTDTPAENRTERDAPR